MVVLGFTGFNESYSDIMSYDESYQVILVLLGFIGFNKPYSDILSYLDPWVIIGCIGSTGFMWRRGSHKK